MADPVIKCLYFLVWLLFRQKFVILFVGKKIHSEIIWPLKDETFNEMKQTTDVYKQQYEGLLEEYQQYLQDLEILQAKSENLEKWKKVYEDEIAELKESAEKHTEEMVKANNKIAEFNRRDQVWQYGLSSFQGRGTKL